MAEKFLRDTFSGKKWIFGNVIKDMLYLHLPGPVLSLFAIFAGAKSPLILIIATTIAFYFQGGHVYSTIWRTYANPREFNRCRKTYIYVPLMIFALLGTAALFARLDFLMLELFLVINAWHGVRQFHGNNRWYQKLNKIENRRGDFIFQSLCFLPLIHTNIQYVAIIQNIATLLKYQHEILVFDFTIFIALFSIWSFYEIKNFQGGKEINRLFASIFPLAMYGCFFLYVPSKAYNQFGGIALLSAGLALSHGLSYMAMTHLALQRTHSRWVENKVNSLITIIAVFCFIFLATKLSLFAQSSSFYFLKPLVAIHTAAFFSHVVFDSFLWTRQHPEAPIIYQVI